MFKTIFLSFFKNSKLEGIIEMYFEGQKMVFGHALEGAEKKGKVEKVRLKVLNKNFFKRIILFGDIGLGESFIKGEFETENLKDLFMWFIQNKRNLPGFNTKESKNILFEWAKFFARLSHLSNKNTETGSKKNIKSHYDVSNDFYKLWLDETMAYSCALFSGTEDLKQAQLNKYRSICEKADLGPTDSVLEIGSGWGGFSIYAAKNYGCQITTITISDEQYAYAKEKIRQEGLQNKIKILIKDYRKIEGEYDKIVSIEMMEALGHQYVPVFIQKCNSVLKSKGKMVFQCITYPEPEFEAYLKNNNYIKKYIFPGGELLSLEHLEDTIEKTGQLHVAKKESIGLHYAKTLHCWWENFKEKKEEIIKLGFNEEFYRKWYYYFVFCEAGFETSYLDDVQLVVQKN